jgi:NAD(P)H-nitrite reductase large subunit
MEQVVIIGNGIAGVTTALEIRKLSNCRITIISKETPHFFARTALMYVYMGYVDYKATKPYADSFWKEQDINLINEEVVQVQFTKQNIVLANDKIVAYSKLVLATGSVPNKLGLTNEQAIGVSPLYSKQDVDYLIAHSKNATSAVVVGGGLIGVELAEMFASKNMATHFVIREPYFWNNVLCPEEALLVEKHIVEHGVKIYKQQKIEAIIVDGQNKLTEVASPTGLLIKTNLLAVAIGVQPNIEFLRNTELQIDKGILVNENLQTNIPNVYALGDCAQLKQPVAFRKAIEPIWYTAKQMGVIVAKNICGQPTVYLQNMWFNSAKFFNIVYQTYGNIGNKALLNETHFLWQDKKNNISVRLSYDTESSLFLGISSLGLSWRQDFFEHAIKNKFTITKVIDHLAIACFEDKHAQKYLSKMAATFYNQQLKQVVYE